MASTSVDIDPDRYRRVLGQYPTGVCVITGTSDEHGPSGRVVGSFTSVSLDPPLIAFYPARSSTSWPKIEHSGSFCVNILGADQEGICRTFSSKAENKFESVGYSGAPETGSPLIDEIVGWIDCDIESVSDAGDHLLVLGRVRDLGIGEPRLPLVFFQGGYGRFAPLSLAASAGGGSLVRPLRHVDLIRGLMEELSAQLHCRVLAGAQVDDEVIIVASAGYSHDDIDTTTLVGQRLPYLPPSGSVFAAWAEATEQEQWLRHCSPDVRDQHRAALELVRCRGYSVGLLSPVQRQFASTLEAMAQTHQETWPTSLFGLIPKLSYDPPELDAPTMGMVRQVSAPVFDETGRVSLALTAFGFGTPEGGTDHLLELVVETARTATHRIAGRAPAEIPGG